METSSISVELWNISFIFVTLDTFQLANAEISVSEKSAENIELISVTFEVSQLT